MWVLFRARVIVLHQNTISTEIYYSHPVSVTIVELTMVFVISEVGKTYGYPYSFIHFYFITIEKKIIQINLIL